MIRFGYLGRFGLRSLFTVIVLVAIGSGWYVDRSRLKTDMESATTALRKSEYRQKLLLLEIVTDDSAVGRSVRALPQFLELADAQWDPSSTKDKRIRAYFKDNDGTPYKTCRVYWFGLDVEQKEGHLVGFYVIASEGTIVDVDVIAPLPFH